MSRRTDEFELRDPALSALLRESFADDPALEESPGRTERIMRLVLASGVKPERRRFSWAPLGWAFSAAGLAVALVFLTIVLARTSMPGGNQVANNNPIPEVTKQENMASRGTDKIKEPAPDDQPVKQDDLLAQKLPVPKERKPEQWEPQRPEQKLPAPAEVASESTPEQIAATLYDAGTVAHAVGDYEAAYTAFQASYEVVPTPSAVLASSDALAQLAAEVLEG